MICCDGELHNHDIIPFVSFSAEILISSTDGNTFKKKKPRPDRDSEPTWIWSIDEGNSVLLIFIHRVIFISCQIVNQRSTQTQTHQLLSKHLDPVYVTATNHSIVLQHLPNDYDGHLLVTALQYRYAQQSSLHRGIPITRCWGWLLLARCDICAALPI